MLDRIRTFLLDDPVWTSHSSSLSMNNNISPLSNIDDTHDFHRIWSALQFVYCLPTRHENDMNVEQLYGEGLNFAGCTIIRLLNEHRKFETYDFTYHLFKINRSDQKEDEVKNVVRIKKFFENFYLFISYH
jgi:cytoplasmic FMR1 interacting protein